MGYHVNYTSPVYSVDHHKEYALKDATIEYLERALEEQKNNWRSLFEAVKSGDRLYITDMDQGNAVL